MTTIDIPAPYVPYLKSAAIYTLAEEANRTKDAEAEVWRRSEGPPKKRELAEDDLANVRPYLDRIIPLAQRIAALPDGEDAILDDEPELMFYVLHVMASKVLGPRLAGELDYLPMPEGVPALAAAIGWASAESVRLEAERVKDLRREAVAA